MKVIHCLYSSFYKNQKHENFSQITYFGTDCVGSVGISIKWNEAMETANIFHMWQPLNYSTILDTVNKLF